MHYTLPQLMGLDELYPTQRKLLVVPSVNFGRELLAALAHARGAWVGWEAATLATIAQKLSVVELAAQGQRRASDVAVADTVSAAFDDAALAGNFSRELAALAWSSGTRSAIVDAILEMRAAGVSVSQLEAVAPLGVAHSLALILARYETLLEQRGLADSIAVFNAAVLAFEAEAPFVLDHAVMVCTPGWTVRGAPRALFGKLVDHGLRVLRPVAVPQLPRPSGLVDELAEQVDVKLPENAVNPSNTMFCAGSVADELREVVRRAVSEGRKLDEIEIAATDRETYGVILESLCQHLGANATFIDGLPLSATRIGRALDRWFSWVESDYAANHIRAALESGDWEPADQPANTGQHLASELRRLRIGWGLEATQRAAVRLRSAEYRNRFERYGDETDDQLARRISARTRTMDALAGLLEQLVLLAPAAGALNSATAQISAPEIAERTLAVLSLVKARGPAEQATLQRLIERLREIADVPRKQTSSAYALATLRQELADLRAWTNTSDTGRPRRATGGHLHFTNIDSAGATGRPLLFLVGLDADRTAGPVLQSPLLPDTLRTQLNNRGAELPTIEQRRRERAWQLAIAMSGTTAKVSLSYAIRGGADGRDALPAPALLHAARKAHNNEAIGYSELNEIIGAPVSALPSAPENALDARDVVLSHMSDGPLLLNAEQAVRALYPGLNRGLNAVDERLQSEAGTYHGLVPAAGHIDPRQTQRPVSPSSLEMIAACSLRWFYANALNARAPEEPVFDAMVWLNVLERGTALHLIYERVIGARLHEQAPGAERRAAVTAIVTAVANELALTIPAANLAVQAREIAALTSDAQLFVNSEHEAFQREPWETLALESAFGVGDGATLPLDDGTSVRVHGRVDRVDRLRDGTLRLVDYKTGRAFELDTKRGAFDGGRKLQLAVYSPAVSRQFAAVVSMAEYHFPTAKGDGAIARADRDLLDAAPRIVRSLLDDVAEGRFVATIDKEDCAFCNYAVICRTRVDDFNNTESPRAEWARTHAPGNPHFVGVVGRTTRVDSSQ